jgi:plasmid stabilization system protein ParE
LRTAFFSPAARRDLAEIADYVSNAAGPSIAEEVILRIRYSPTEVEVVRILHGRRDVEAILAGRLVEPLGTQ